MCPGNLSIFEKALSDGSIRKTPDGSNIVVNDVVRCLTGKSRLEASKTVNRLLQEHLELIPFLRTYSFGVGRPNEVMDAEGIIMLIMILPGLKAGKFRQSVARLLCRYMAADITLADDILQRNQKPKDAKWLAERAQGVVVRRELTDAIKDHGGEKTTYVKVTDMNNVAVTGLPAREIKRVRSVKNTREAFTVGELAAMSLTEHLEAVNIDNRDAKGHDAIVSAASEVASDIGDLMSKYRRNEIVVEASIN